MSGIVHSNLIPNIALAPLRWNVEKVRAEFDAKLASLANCHREASERSRALFKRRRQQLTSRLAKERMAALLASRPSQPKRFDTLRATVANLKRLGRTKDAVEKEMRLNQMELDYWHRSPGCAFEDKARAEIARLESEEFAAEAAEKDAYRKKMTTTQHAMDTAVKMVMRSNLRTVDKEVWKASHLSACGNAEKLRELLQRRGKNAAEERDRDTAWPPLFFAARSGSIECAKLLLECGADARARDPSSSTALHVAAAYSSVDVAALLLEHDGKRPLDIAAERDRCRRLLKCLEDWIAPGSSDGPSQKETKEEVLNEEKRWSDMEDPKLRTILKKLHLKQTALGKDHPGLIPTLNAACAAYRASRVGSHCAQGLLERAVHLTEKAHGPNSLAAATAWNNLGELYHTTRADEDAQNACSFYCSVSFEKSLKIVECMCKDDSSMTTEQRARLISPPLRNLSLHTFACGDMETSIPLLSRLLALSEALFRLDFVPDSNADHKSTTPLESIDLLPVLNTLGYAHLLDGNPDAARAKYERALNIVTAHSGHRSLETVQLLEHIALVEYYAENFVEAERSFVEASKVLRENGRDKNDADVRRNVENAATAACRLGPRAL